MGVVVTEPEQELGLYIAVILMAFIMSFLTLASGSSPFIALAVAMAITVPFFIYSISQRAKKLREEKLRRKRQIEPLENRAQGYPQSQVDVRVSKRVDQWAEVMGLFAKYGRPWREPGTLEITKRQMMRWTENSPEFKAWQEEFLEDPMPVDYYAREDEYEFVALIGNIPADDIIVDVDGSRVTIRVEGYTGTRETRSKCSIEKSFKLPVEFLPDEAWTEKRGPVLHIHLPIDRT